MVPESNCNRRCIIVSAPGSMMLMGEHAVVFGYLAIACALDTYIEVSLEARDDRQIVIDSALGAYQSSIDKLQPDSRLRFVLESITQYRTTLPSGFNLKISSQFSHTQGLGSSAAVTVATVKALAEYCAQPLSDAQHLSSALKVVHAVQGRGSGTDLAASIYGGVISYQAQPAKVTRLAGLPKLALHYSGYKTTTGDVLGRVAQQKIGKETLYDALYQLMGQCTEKAVNVLADQDWEQFGQLMNFYQGLMDALNVNDATLSAMIYQLRGQEGVLGAKISGSGLGDCVISLGQCVALQGYPLISIKAAARGVECRVNEG